MTRQCWITKKRALFGKKRSHAMNTSNRRWNVNLQKVRMKVDGKMVTKRISVRAYRTLKKNIQNSTFKSQSDK